MEEEMTKMVLEYKSHSIGGRFDERFDEQAIEVAVKALAFHLCVAESSIHYLLQNGWSQSLQDSFAGPRAKALKDGEDETTVEAVIDAAIAKRVKSIVDGTIEAGKTKGRDPIRSTAKAMLSVKAAAANKVLPKGEKLEELVTKWLEVEANLDAVKAEIAARRKKGDEVTLEDL
jgi:hypothetical protein